MMESLISSSMRSVYTKNTQMLDARVGLSRGPFGDATAERDANAPFPHRASRRSSHAPLLANASAMREMIRGS
jgi:hypothetical protein